MAPVMEFIKKNLISLICGVVALAAVIVGLTMVSSQAAQLQTDLDARKQAHQTLADLLNKSRDLPGVDPDNATQEKLKAFPSPFVVAQGEAIAKKVVAASNAMRDAAVAMNTHTLLEPGSLPSPSSPAAYNFRQHYQRYFPPHGTPLDSQLAIDLHAGMPPTPDVITAKQTEEAASITRDKLYILPTGQPGNQDEVTQLIAQAAKELPGKLMKEAAQKSKVYITPDTFVPYSPILQSTGVPDPIDIYNAQLTLWLQEDIVSVVNECNASSKNILDAPVKLLARVVAAPVFIRAASSATATDPDAALPKEPSVSPTGRVCNGMYDVFHVDVEAEVEAAKLADFLRAFGHDRFITPLWADVTAVDNATALSQGHMYGDNPVINVKLRCEVLYLRKWDQPLMPQKIREGLGIPADRPGAAGATPTASAQ